jgi:hypothetical protein
MDLESILSRCLFKSEHRLLREQGWVEMKGGACISVKRETTTSDAAKDTVRKIVEDFEYQESLNPDIDWQEILEANPEGYSANSGWSDPADPWRGGTYAQAMRESYELYFGERDESGRRTTPSIYGGNLKVKRPDEHPGD